jgi:hypothetical protein
VIYYENKLSKYTTGVINFRHLETRIEKSTSNKCQFELIFKGYKSLKFKAKNQREAYQWTIAIQKQLDLKPEIQQIDIGPKPWHFDTIDEQEFLEKA